MSKGNQTLLVAAIDFGTTYSGYAFSFRHEFEQDPLKVCASSWTTGSRVSISLKTSSTILFKQNRQFDSFGFEVEDKYSDLALDDEHRDWYYFRRFKMMLYNAKDVHRTSLIKDETGKELPAMEVFAAAIRYLKDHMMQSCTERMIGGDINIHDIRWVLTVPAIWDDAAKQFMREAAEKAGIPGDCLVLALEPEAASLFCKYLPLERIAGSTDKKITCFRPKSKYLVLDAGGGTIDITVHEVLGNGNLRELHKANGGAWGGTTIDMEFLGILETITGPEVMKRFREENKDDFMDLLREFEVKKRSIQPDMESKVTFKIPISLHELFRDVTKGEIREAVRGHPTLNGKVTFAGDKMRVDPRVAQSLFEETNRNITNHIKTILANPVAKDTASILMVGGFSESPMLRHAVQTAFSSLRVIIPYEAGLAVLKGAVIFGHNSTVITARIAKYTYGFKMYEHFDPQIHPQKKMIISNGRQMVQGIFDKLVEAGQSVSPEEPCATKYYAPLKSSGSGFTIKLYATQDKNPKFIDDDGCFRIGEVNVDCRDRHGRPGNSAVSLIFGGTELKVIAINEDTKEETHASFDFIA